jgi:hypothetical protein
MNQCPPGPQVFNWGRFEFFQKFAEIFANEYLSPSTTPAINCSAVSTTSAKNLLPVSMTPAINPCHREITKKPCPAIFELCFLFVCLTYKLYIDGHKGRCVQPVPSSCHYADSLKYFRSSTVLVVKCRP